MSESSQLPTTGHDGTTDWDAVLAHQLTWGWSEDGVEDAFATIAPRQSSADALPSYDYDYDEDRDLMAAIQASLSRETIPEEPPEELLPPLARPSFAPPGYSSAIDRYDRRGIATFSSRPRRGRNMPGRTTGCGGEASSKLSLSGSLRKLQLLASLTPTSTSTSTSSESERSLSLQLALCSQHTSTLQPLKGIGIAPMLNLLGVDTFLCVLDHLHFPDAFALAITCKALYAQIDLPRLKREYFTRLCELQGYGMMPGRLPCHTCVYCLDPCSYFPGLKGSVSTDEWICIDCKETRARVTAATVADAAAKGRAQLVSPVWRPSRRVSVPGTDGFLWYRDRG